MGRGEEEKEEEEAHSKGKNKTETVPEKDLMVDLLDKDFKTTVCKLFKELKEDVKKDKKT